MNEAGGMAARRRRGCGGISPRLDIFGWQWVGDHVIGISLLTNAYLSFLSTFVGRKSEY